MSLNHYLVLNALNHNESLIRRRETYTASSSNMSRNASRTGMKRSDTLSLLHGILEEEDQRTWSNPKGMCSRGSADDIMKTFDAKAEELRDLTSNLTCAPHTVSVADDDCHGPELTSASSSSTLSTADSANSEQFRLLHSQKRIVLWISQRRLQLIENWAIQQRLPLKAVLLLASSNAECTEVDDHRNSRASSPYGSSSSSSSSCWSDCDGESSGHSEHDSRTHSSAVREPAHNLMKLVLPSDSEQVYNDNYDSEFDMDEDEAPPELFLS